MSSKNKKNKPKTIEPKDFMVKITDLNTWKSLASKTFGVNGAKYSFEHKDGFLVIEFFMIPVFDKASGMYKNTPQVSIWVGKDDKTRKVFQGNIFDVPVSTTVKNAPLHTIEHPVTEDNPADDEEEDDDDEGTDVDFPELEPGAFRPITNLMRRRPLEELVTADVFNRAQDLLRIDTPPRIVVETPDVDATPVVLNPGNGVRVADHLNDERIWAFGETDPEPRDL